MPRAFYRHFDKEASATPPAFSQQALGWRSKDLFDLHPIAALARYDAMGLIWLLRGRPVLALTEGTAAIENASGAITVYHRS
jgi:hypothetical protein